MADHGNAAAVVETTSHGLAADRVLGIAYDLAILTNLTHEHLEFHGSWEAYRDAKLSLFERLAPGPTNPPKQLDGRDWPKAAIVNADDPTAGAFIGVAQEAGARVLTYGTDPAADVRATHVEEDAQGLRIAFVAPSGAADLTLRLRAGSTSTTPSPPSTVGEVLGLDPAAVREGLAVRRRRPGPDGAPGSRASRSAS